MEEEKYINNLVLDTHLSSDGMGVYAYSLKKIRKTNRKADSMIVERPFDGSYISSTNTSKEEERKYQRSSERKQAKKEKAKEKDNTPQEDNRPWYQKHFWMLAIGGMIGYNIMTFDKSKFKEAMEQANQQANAQRRN
jgi:tRNA U34 5-methylaminomethyl-2-thiouridine-forming methyltransferase MnmC